MADLIRRKQGDVRASQRLDPFQMLHELMTWEPFQQLERGWDRDTSFMPAFDLQEKKDAFLLKADLPGVKEEDIDLSITGDRLTISGKREAEHREEGDQQYLYERSYGSFMRTFTLPPGCDPENIAAELKDGVLSVRLPKRPEVQAKKISLKSLAEKVTGKAKA